MDIGLRSHYKFTFFPTPDKYVRTAFTITC